MKAYVTLLSDAKYYDGVIALGEALKAVGARYPLYCVLSAEVEARIEGRLNQEGIPSIRLTDSVLVPKNLCADPNFAHWSKTFDKLKIWGLTQFEKVVYLDSDLLILNNIDHLFENAPFSGVCAGKSYPGNESWRGINSGLVVIKPDHEVEQRLITLLPSVAEAYKKIGRVMGDQDVIQWYVTDEWSDRPELNLDEGYNIFASYLTYYIKNLGYTLRDDGKGKRIYAIHFIGKTKPWMKHSIRNYCGLLKSLFKNPYYLVVRWKFLSYLRNR